MNTLREAAQQALEAHANRYQVVRDGYWWRVKIGDGTQTVGQHHTETGALRLASELHRAFHDGGFVVQEALKAALTEEALQRLTDVHQEIEAVLEQPKPPPEAQSEAEKIAYCAGWWAAMAAKAKEQPEQEPATDEQIENAMLGIWQDVGDPRLPGIAHPPRREWRGLTDDEKADIMFELAAAGSYMDCAHAIEAALKERNAL